MTTKHDRHPKTSIITVPDTETKEGGKGREERELQSSECNRMRFFPPPADPQQTACAKERSKALPPLLIHLLSSRCVVQHCPDLAPCRRRPPAALFTSVPDIRKKRHSLFHRRAPPFPLPPSVRRPCFFFSSSPSTPGHFSAFDPKRGGGGPGKEKKGGGRREGRTGMRKELEEGTAFDETDAGG